MSDLKNGGMPFDTRALYLSDAALKQGIDLLLLATRNIVSHNDGILKKYNLGQAHARALHFIWRRPGLPVAELIATLRVTKQSLSRVLNDLTAAGLIERQIGRDDRRVRSLNLSTSGAELAEALWQARRPLIAQAFRAAGQDAVAGFRDVLTGLVEAQDRANIPS